MTLRLAIKHGSGVIMVPRRLAVMVLEEKLDNMYSLHWDFEERHYKMIVNMDKYNIDRDTYKMLVDEMVILKLRLLGKVPVI